MKTLIQASLLICLPYVVTATCMLSREYYTRGDHGIPFCVDDLNMPHIEFLLPGEYYLDVDNCRNCSCYVDGLSCCGYGIGAGLMWAPPHCKVKELGDCDYRIVKKDNEDEDCFGDQHK